MQWYCLLFRFYLFKWFYNIPSLTVTPWWNCRNFKMVIVCVNALKIFCNDQFKLVFWYFFSALTTKIVAESANILTILTKCPSDIFMFCYNSCRSYRRTIHVYICDPNSLMLSQSGRLRNLWEISLHEFRFYHIKHWSLTKNLFDRWQVFNFLANINFRQ